jgi:hypothetical protein
VRFFDLFAGKLFVAVDAFVWLYELISSCAAGRGGVAVAGVMALTTGENAARLPDIPLMRPLEDVAAEE